MEKGKRNKESEILKALESIHSENQNLQQCLEEIVITRKFLDDKWDSANNLLSSFLEENYNLEDTNILNRKKIKTVEKEISELEESKNVLADNKRNLQAEIKEYKEMFEAKIDNLVVASDNLCGYFLLAVSNNEKIEEEYLTKLVEDLDTMKVEIMEKENNIEKMKIELEEYDFPEDPLESQVQTKERQFVMNMLENNLENAKQHLQELNKLKTEKEIEESEM